MENSQEGNPVSTSVKPSSRLVVALSVLFLILGIVIGYALAVYIHPSNVSQIQEQPIPDIQPTSTIAISNFQTIKDELGRYQIKVPENWKLVEHSSSFQNSNRIEAGDMSVFQISLFETSATNLATYLAEQDEADKTSWEGKSGRLVISTKQTTLLGLPATERVEDWLSAGFQTISTYILIDNTVYQFVIFPGSEDDYRKTEVFANYITVLNTFEPLSSISTVTPVKVSLMDSTNWVSSTCGKISYKLPPAYSGKCVDNQDGTQDIFISKDGSYTGNISIFVRTYNGGSRREYWISNIKATKEDVAKYIRFQDSLFGSVRGLDVFGSSGWWQGGYANPIMIANNKTIVLIHGGRNFNDVTGEITRWEVTDTIASTIKFITP